MYLWYENILNGVVYNIINTPPLKSCQILYIVTIQIFLHSNQDCTRAFTHQFLNRPCKEQRKLRKSKDIFLNCFTSRRMVLR